MKSNPVDELVFQCKAAKLPEPAREYVFAKPRRWRADLVFPLPPRFQTTRRPLMVEVEGGLHIQGRHSRGVGMENDMEKYAHAMMLGYRVLRVSPRHIRNGDALNWIEALLK